jgi:uncharacterized lipoprotein YajG
MFKKITLWIPLVALALLAGCAEHNGPMERAGRAMDHAGNATVRAVGTGMSKAGAAIERGGRHLEQKASRK